MHDANSKSASPIALVAVSALWLLWQCIRWPVLAFLIVLEPVARAVFAGFALIGTLTAFFFEFVVGRSAFPFWGMLAVSLGAFGVLVLYYALIRWLSPD
jgi:hypothetical protein